MNILDYKGDTFHHDTWIRDMWDRQYNVYLKYKQIEKMPENFGSIQTRETQRWVKDFINRVNEEVAESYESIRDPNMQVLVKKEIKNEEGEFQVIEYDIHRSEELADALHFYLEMLIIIGKTPEWLIKTFEEYVQRGRRVYVDDIILNYWEVSYQLGMLGNCLKLKPWKQDEVLTDLDKVDHQLKEVFFALLDVFAANGNDYNDIYDLYTRKNQVNQFRQREWVLERSKVMDEEVKFEKTIFQKFPWLNLVMTIAVMILQIVVAIIDYFRGQYFWTVWFILFALVYLFLMVPTSYRIMKRTMQNNKDMRDLEKRINEQRERWKL